MNISLLHIPCCSFPISGAIQDGKAKGKVSVCVCWKGGGGADFWPPGSRNELGTAKRASRGAACRWPGGASCWLPEGSHYWGLSNKAGLVGACQGGLGGGGASGC